jgi:ribonuclease HI
MPKITAYTDGACSNNPGPGGYGIVLKSGKHFKKLSGGFFCTTNNRMELMAAIVALEALLIPKSEVLLFSDSKYLVDSVEKGWVFNWEKKGFKNRVNSDLWIRFLKVYRQHDVKLEWVKGHNGQEENEICDRLAVSAYESGNLVQDSGYYELRTI